MRFSRYCRCSEYRNDRFRLNCASGNTHRVVIIALHSYDTVYTSLVIVLVIKPCLSVSQASILEHKIQCQQLTKRLCITQARNVNLVKRSRRFPDDGLSHSLSLSPFPRIILSTARGIIVLSRNQMFSFKILQLLDGTRRDYLSSF